MAIVRDSDGVWDSAHDNPVAGSVVVGALTDGILRVSFADLEFGGTPGDIINGVSSDQDGAFTQINGNVNQNSSNAQSWYLLSPTPATHLITISYGSSAGDAPTAAMWDLWSGVDQTTPFGTPNSTVVSSDSPSVTVTTAAGEVVLDVLAMQPGATETEGANQTKIRANSASAGANSIRGATSQQAGADGGVMSWSLSSSTSCALLAVSMKPAAAAPAGASGPLLGGAGRGAGPGSPLLGGPGTLLQRSMEKAESLWVPSRTIVPVSVQVQGA